MTTPNQASNLPGSGGRSPLRRPGAQPCQIGAQPCQIGLARGVAPGDRPCDRLRGRPPDPTSAAVRNEQSRLGSAEPVPLLLSPELPLRSGIVRRWRGREVGKDPPPGLPFLTPSYKTTVRGMPPEPQWRHTHCTCRGMRKAVLRPLTPTLPGPERAPGRAAEEDAACCGGATASADRRGSWRCRG